MIYLQTFVIPICRLVESEGQAYIKRLHGTSFFVNQEGVFQTARHVIETARIDVEENGGFIGLCAKSDEKSDKNVAVPILSCDIAEKPFDIAIGKVNHSCKTFLTLKDIEVAEWQDIATLGYPETALNIKPDSLNIGLRVHKGYIQRVLSSDWVLVGEHPSCFETSFPITAGLSGAPLFVHTQSFDIVIGVRVGSYRSRVVDYEEVISDEDGIESKQVHFRVEEFGIAHDIRPLLSWRPACLEGKSLAEISEQS